MPTVCFMYLSTYLTTDDTDLTIEEAVPIQLKIKGYKSPHFIPKLLFNHFIILFPIQGW